MKKIFNFRPIVFFALSLIVGGYFFVATWAMEYFWILICAIILVLAGVGIYSLIKTGKRRVCLTLLVCFIIPFVLGGTIADSAINKRIETHTQSGEYIVSGTVSSGGYRDGAYVIMLEDVTLLKENTIEEPLREVEGEVMVFAFGEDSNPVYVGDKVTFNGSYTYHYYADIKNSPLNAWLSTGVIYYNSGLEITEGKGFKYNILKHSKIKIEENMDRDAGDIAYAMLFGDKSLMSSKLKEDYAIAGLSHILAVSGLHVGFVIMLFGFFLKRLIKNKWAYAGVLISVLLFYAYLCSWSPSVLRAVVMCAVVLLSKAVFAQYDGLNALGLAGIVNVIVAPLNIFGVGFLLSFSVVFAIFAISPYIKYLLKDRLPKKLASSLAITISAWLGSLPITLYYFKYLSLYAVVANFVILPLISGLFIIIVITLILSFIPGCAKFFLDIPNFLISCLNFVVEGISELKFASIDFSATYLIMLLGVVALILASEYCFIKRKRLYAGFLAFGFLCCTIVNTLQGVIS